jgi:hypothetical protein
MMIEKLTRDLIKERLSEANKKEKKAHYDNSRWYYRGLAFGLSELLKDTRTIVKHD